MEEYHHWKDFKNLYLEDSYVLEIKEEKDKLIFKMEFVLLEDHELYHPPKPNEQYCYQYGSLELSGVRGKVWMKKKYPNNVSTDINGESEYGNIDAFYKELDTYFIEGSWGEIKLHCEKLNVKYIVT